MAKDAALDPANLATAPARGAIVYRGAGPQFDKKKDERECDVGVLRNGHCHDTEEQASTEIFTVKLTGDDIFSVGTNIDGGEEGLYETNDRFDAVRVRGFQMELSDVILDAVFCGVDDLPSDQTDLPNPLTGNLGFGNFLDDYIILFFDYNGAEHWFESQIDELDPWPPTVAGGPVTVTQGTGEWSMNTKGKNHQDGCTGEGGPLSIEWEAEVTNITGTR